MISQFRLFVALLFIAMFVQLAHNVLRICEAGDFFRNTSANPNIAQNRNLSNVMSNPGFANALLWAGFTYS